MLTGVCRKDIRERCVEFAVSHMGEVTNPAGAKILDSPATFASEIRTEFNMDGESYEGRLSRDGAVRKVVELRAFARLLNMVIECYSLRGYGKIELRQSTGSKGTGARVGRALYNERSHFFGAFAQL